MIIGNAAVGSIICDSLPFSMTGTPKQALALAGSGVSAMACYLGVINKDRLQSILDAGMEFLPVTLAGRYSGPAALASLAALGIPLGATVFLDLEGSAAFAAGDKMIATVNGWAKDLKSFGYIPGLYVGVPQPLTSDELWHLGVERYWRGQGSVRDRKNALAEPTGCGWCMTQAYPSVQRGGVLVDCNIVSQDYRGRVPTLVYA